MKSGFQMSISIICSLVVALFLFMSIHPCNARRLLDIKRDAELSFHLSNEEIAGRSIRVRAWDPSNAQNSDSNEFHKGTLNKDFSQETITIIKANDGEHYYPRKTLTEINVPENGVDSSSSSNVSWQVPHNKGEHQQEPGFNLDYSPPKTHPPVHN